MYTFTKVTLLLRVVPASREFENPSHFIDAPDFEENTALHLACREGYKEIAELLLSQGTELVDGETQYGQHTPLHLAAAYGHVDLVELLMSHGAPVDCRDELQRTPIQRWQRLTNLSGWVVRASNLKSVARGLKSRFEYLYIIVCLNWSWKAPMGSGQKGVPLHVYTYNVALKSYPKLIKWF